MPAVHKTEQSHAEVANFSKVVSWMWEANCLVPTTMELRRVAAMVNCIFAPVLSSLSTYLLRFWTCWRLLPGGGREGGCWHRLFMSQMTGQVNFLSRPYGKEALLTGRWCCSSWFASSPSCHCLMAGLVNGDCPRSRHFHTSGQRHYGPSPLYKER